jgi:hypothetical protein
MLLAVTAALAMPSPTCARDPLWSTVLVLAMAVTVFCVATTVRVELVTGDLYEATTTVTEEVPVLGSAFGALNEAFDGAEDFEELSDFWPNEE